MASITVSQILVTILVKTFKTDVILIVFISKIIVFDVRLTDHCQYQCKLVNTETISH